MKAYDQGQKIHYSIRAIDNGLRIHSDAALSEKAKADKAKLEVKRREVDATLSRISHSLALTDSWPTGPLPGADNVRTKHDAMLQVLDNLTLRITALDKTVDAVREQQSEEHGIEIDAEPEESFSNSGWRPLKRRRDSDGEFKIANKELKEIRDTFEALEDDLAELHNVITQHRENLQGEVVGLLETRHEEIEAAKLAGTDPEGLWRTETTTKVNRLEGDLKELSIELAALIGDSDKVNKATQAAQREYQELHGEMNQVSISLFCSIIFY